jgi:hypothetical protein
VITLRWAQYPEAQVASYRVYRSIIGFVAPFIDLNGKTLQLKINGGVTQTFNFTSASAVDTINATIVGGRAYLAFSGVQFLLRSDNRETGSVQIVGGTALTDLGLTARTITAQSEDLMLATVAPAIDPNDLVEFQDQDGVIQDWYALTTIDTFSNESLKTAYRQPISSTGPLCVIEGIVMNLQGARVVDAEVIATVQAPPEGSGSMSNITPEPISVLSGPDGRFSLPVLQKAIIRLEIPSMSLCRMIRVPESAYAFINDIAVDLDYRYPLGYRG